MKLEFYNCPKPQEIESVTLPKPAFLGYEPDFALIKKTRTQYQQYSNILIIGHGGSINCFVADYFPLRYQSKKQVYILNTVDPDYIFELNQKLRPENTLVLSISKSGENTTQLEEMMPFTDYPMLVVTGKSSPLRALAEKLKLRVINHPDIGGRFNSFTEVALLPAGLCGLDIKGLYDGAKKFYDMYDRDNLAWRAASVFYQLEQKGFVDVFLPVYSHNLFPAAGLVVQLCHESFGKAGRGQSYLAAEAPESQHHTNQRFFGGPKNIAGFFIGSRHFLHPTLNTFPPATHSVQVKGRHLADISKIPLEKSLEFELAATLEDARINSIPCAHLSIADFSAEEIGEFSAFWQLYAVYSSVLRGVNPFDQPQVENSKNISFNKRLQYKGLL